MKTILCDPYLSDECKSNLANMGYIIKQIPPFDKLPKPISSHPDILLYKLNDRSILMGEEYYRTFSDFYDSLGVDIVTDPISPCGEYPADVLFDALAVGNTVYGKNGAVSGKLLDNYIRFVPVKQGYTRCSVAMLTETAAVTADGGIAKALKKDGVNVLEICPGSVFLDGYDHGFIGGAGGKLDDATYCFFGDLLHHPDGEKIRMFAESQKINAVSLSGEPLRDHGGFIVV